MSVELTLKDIISPADYLKRRDSYRTEVIATKKKRTIAVGANVTLLFENRATVLYQVLEMLRIEKTSDPAAVQAELDAYNPLIPAGKDWRATMMIEFEDAEERRVQLKYMRGIEQHVHAGIGARRITALADEDMERSNAEKTSAVHFLRFPLDDAAIADLRGGAALVLQIDHPRYGFETEVDDPAVRASLLADLA